MVFRREYDENDRMVHASMERGDGFHGVCRSLRTIRKSRGLGLIINEERPIRVELRVSQHELDKLKMMAASYGCSVSKYLHTLLRAHLEDSVERSLVPCQLDERTT